MREEQKDVDLRDEKELLEAVNESFEFKYTVRMKTGEQR